MTEDLSPVYRGATRQDAERAYHLDARIRVREGYVPAAEDWSTALGQQVLTVRYIYSPQQAPAVMEALAGAEANAITHAAPQATDIASPAVASQAHGPPPPAPASTPSHRGRNIAIAIAVVLALAYFGSRNTSTQPSSQPAASVAGPSEADRWTEFAAWAAGDFQAITTDMSDLSEAAEDGDLTGVILAAERMEATAGRHLSYLSAHPPAPCYASLFSDVRSAVLSAQSSARSAQAADFDAAIASMQATTGHVTTATGKLEAANAACTG